MTTAFVLSGGGARGDFEAGAIRLLYDRGVHPDILAGTSVGAINAAKLAEGEGAPNQGFQGLLGIWLSLRWNTDMWQPAEWLSQIDRRLREALLSQTSPRIAAPRATNLTWGDLGAVVALVDQAAWMLGEGAAILTALDKLSNARSLATLQPIINRITGPSSALDQAKISTWASGGRKLRLATVCLETGRLRYVTESGAVVERDHVTPVGTMPGRTPEIDRLEQEIATLAAEIEALQAELSTAAPNQKGALATRIKQLTATLTAAQLRLNQAKKVVGQVPLVVPLGAGVIASASIAMVFPPVRLGDEYYVDGGHRDVLPVQAAMDLGANTIYAVLSSPPVLDPPTPDRPNPWPESYADKKLPSIAARALISIHLDEIVAAEITKPCGYSGIFAFIAPTIDIHDAFTVDPGLIRINIGYGYMRAADVLDGVTPSSSGWISDADAITLLRAQIWRQECELFGRPIPTAPNEASQTPTPQLYGEVLADAARLRGLVTSRLQAGGALPPEAGRWGTTWEDHPWFADCEGPVTAIRPAPDVLAVFAPARDRRTMTARWLPNTGWRGWRGIAHGYGAADTFVTAVTTGGEVHAFMADSTGRIIQSVQPLGSRIWSPWWPVGATGVGIAPTDPGAAVHAVSRVDGHIALFYANTYGSILTTDWTTTTGWSLPRQVLGGKTRGGGHVTGVSRNPSQLDIFAVGTDGVVYTAAWSTGSGWQGWWPISGALGYPGSYVSAVSRSSDKLDIFFADRAGNTQSAAWEPAVPGWRGWWHIQSGVTMPGGYVTAVCRNTDLLDIFHVGTDWRVYTAAWSPNLGWGGWWGVAGASARRDLPVWPVSRRTDYLDVFFTTPANSIQTAAWAPGSSAWGGPWPINDHWELDDLTL